MYLCYIDESGTPDIPGNTSHFILAGLSIHESKWFECDKQIETIKKQFQISESEIHAGWILRPYSEQTRIINFNQLDYFNRKSQVESYRKSELFRLQRSGNRKLYNQIKKNYEKTDAYKHLTHTERTNLIFQIVDCVSQWQFARLFAECIDKIFFDPNRTTQSINEQAFEQIVSRFEQYLQIINKSSQYENCGILIYDNNLTVSKKHTDLMKYYHNRGTFWTKIQKIIETPLFVDSQLTSMVQIADICAYVLRRYLENNENELFDKIFQRADRKDEIVVGVRHFANKNCNCKICMAHKKI